MVSDHPKFHLAALICIDRKVHPSSIASPTFTVCAKTSRSGMQPFTRSQKRILKNRRAQCLSKSQTCRILRELHPRRRDFFSSNFRLFICDWCKSSVPQSMSSNLNFTLTCKHSILSMFHFQWKLVATQRSFQPVGRWHHKEETED